MSLVRWRDGAFDITVMSKMADLDSTNYRLERVDTPVGTSDNAEADSGTHSPKYRLERADKTFGTSRDSRRNRYKRKKQKRLPQYKPKERSI